MSTALTGTGAQCLVVDPRDPRTIYAGTHGQGVWKSTDGGVDWQRTSLPQLDVFSVAVSPADGRVYAGCEPSMLFRSVDGGHTWEELSALRALPSAPTWSFPPRPWTSHVRWIAPNPQDPDLLLVGIELGGLMYSRDGGRTWADHRPGAQRDVHAIAWHPRDGSRAYEAGGGGAAWSFDSGWTWEPADEGRGRHYTWALTVHPDDPDCWYISASPGPSYAHSGYYGGSRHANARIYRWRGKGPWGPLSGGLPDPFTSMPYALTATREELYAGLSDGSIYVSVDKGDTWQQMTLRGDRLRSVVALATVE
ncbi:MAG: hypothetical protein HY660_00055 [Armatimonadetes bacterium]|nr:hypothetical protein [Armatimonadota bacterium]